MKTVRFEKTHEKAFRSLDEELADEVLFHKGVIENSAVAAVEDNIFFGAGYLLQGPGRFIHLKFATDVKSEKGIEGAEALLHSLIGTFQKLGPTDTGEAPVLRLWCRDTDDAYEAFLGTFGFQKRDVMYRMERELKLRPGKENEAVSIETVALDTEDEMRSYLFGTAEAFGFPDRAEEMRYRIDHLNGTVCTVRTETHEKGAFLTIWPIDTKSAATENIFTLKPYRRRGYASALVEHAAAVLGREGYEKAILTVYESDEEALILYRKAGYELKTVLHELWLEEIS